MPEHPAPGPSLSVARSGSIRFPGGKATWTATALLAVVAACLGGLLLIGYGLEAMVSLDKVVPTPNQIRADDLLAPFNIGVVRLLPIEFNADTNRLEYEYETSVKDSSELMLACDKASARAGWKRIESAEGERSYSKFVRANTQWDVEEIVEVKLVAESARVKVVNRRGSWRQHRTFG